MALLFNNSGAGNITLSSPDTGNYKLVFPPTAGTAGYYLQTDGEGNLSWSLGKSTMGDGSVDSPGLPFSADTDTGFYRPKNNTIGIVAQGIEVATITNNSFTINNGHLVLQQNPTLSSHAATKQYVDEASSVIVIEDNVERRLTNIDAGRYIRTTNANRVKLTVASQAATPWNDNTEIIIEQGGTGQVVIAPGANVVINVADGFVLRSAHQYTVIVLKRTGTDCWTLSGQLERRNPLPANQVSVIPRGHITALDVQTALEELHDDKLSSAEAAGTYITQLNASSSFVDEQEYHSAIGVLMEELTDMRNRIRQLEDRLK